MSASIDNYGCFVWDGNVGCSNTDFPLLSKLRTGRIAYSPHTGTFIVYIGRGRNEKQEISFSLNELFNISLFGEKNTACSFKLSQLNNTKESTNIIIDFKGLRDLKNVLTPAEKAQSFCEFLHRLKSGATASTFFPMNNDAKQINSSRNASPVLLLKNRTNLMTTNKKLKRSNNFININSIDETKNDIDEIVTKKHSRIDTKDVNPLYGLRSRPNRNTTTKNEKVSRYNQHSPSGLTNMGNTCYVNSVLQATFVIDTLSKRLVDSLIFFEKEALNPQLFIERYLPLMKALSNLMHNRIGNNVTNFLESVFKCVRKAGDKFRNNRQEDAHEFLTDMLSQLQSEFNEAVKQLNGRRPYMLHSSDPIRESFGYTIRRTFTCIKCSHESTAEEDSTNFIVHISEERLKSTGFTFADILRDSMAVEEVEHVCEKCKHKHAMVKPEFVHLPEHFIFVIRRYLYNHQSANKQKLHVKVSMHKYLTFVTTSDIFQPTSMEDPVRFSISKPSVTTPNSVVKKTKSGIDNKWRDRKINTSKIGYLINEVDEEAHLRNIFQKLVEKFKNLKVKTKVYPCNEFNPNASEIFDKLAYVLTGGSEALYVKFKEIINSTLHNNADIFCNIMKKSEKAFKSYLKTTQKTETIASNLNLFAIASIFQIILVVNENGKWTSYAPKYIINKHGERKLIKSTALKNKLYLSQNINYIAPELHPKRSRSYRLCSVVCHVGQTAEGGHYKCAVYTSGGQWSMCNDDVVNNCHEKTVLDKSSDSGYILIYTSCKDRSISPKREN